MKNFTEMELNNRIEALEKIYKPLRRAYSIEKMRDGKLVEDSAVYVDSVRDIVEHCSHLQHALHNKEQWYVTTFNHDWWKYNKEFTEIANLIARKNELC